MKLGLGLFCFCVGLWVVRAAPSDEVGRPFFQHFAPRDYRAHQQIWMGAQAPDGVMWFGNSHSVLSYDGSVWRRIEVPTSFVRALAIGSDGRVYVGGTDQLGYLAPGPDGQPAFHSLLDQLPAAQRQLGVIWSMTALGDAVWFATESLVLRWYEGKFTTWPMTNKPRQYLIAVGRELYVHRQGVGLFRFDGAAFTLVSAAPELLQTTNCFLEPGLNGALLVGTATGAFYDLRGGQLTPHPTPLDALLAGTRLRYVARMPDGTRVFGTSSLGVIVADDAFHFLHRLSGADGLASELILSFTPDREDGLWVGTSNGVVRLEPSPRFTAFDSANGLPRGLLHDFRRHEGVLYAATPGGVVRLTPADAAAGTPANFTPVPGSAEISWSLVSHPSGLLIATNRGVSRYVAGMAAPVSIFEVPDGVSKLAVLPRHPDRLFVGRFVGLNVLHFENGQWRDEGSVPGIATEIRTIAEAVDGTLWLGTPTRGFIKVVRPAGASNDDWSRAVATTYREERGLPTGQGWSHVYNLGADVIFVTDVGTYRYDAIADKFTIAERLRITGRHDRTQLWPLAPTDRPDRAWAQADTEETDIPRQLGLLTLQGQGDAMFSPLPTKILDRVAFGGARSVYWERIGDAETLWLGGPDGVVRAEVRAPAPIAPLQVLLRECSLPDGTQIAPVATEKAPLFSYGHAPLAFTFAAMRYGAGSTLRYQTRLRGDNDEWSPWSPRTEAMFTHLWGGPFTFEVRAQDPDGNVSAPAAFTFSVTPPRHLSGWAFGLYAVVAVAGVYITVRWRLARAERERVRLENLVATRTRDLAVARDQAEAASRAKSSFLASMSHELRTPLNGVLGYAQLLQDDKRLAPDQQERLRIVHQSGEHLLHMINDVLDLAKIEAGKLTLRVASFALGDLLRDIGAAHAHAATAKKLTLTIEIAPDLPAWVEADAQKLRQVLDNLIGNAIKFTAAGNVTLRVSREAAVPSSERRVSSFEFGVPRSSHSKPETPNSKLHDVRIAFAVADTGPGISAADQARLFQAFEQAPSAHATGTGLGLAISRALVERFGGALTLASEPGRGSTFTFSLTLPVAPPGLAALATGRRIVGHDGPPRRVLIVDDHAINRRLLTELLAPLGFDCAEYESPADALARLARGAEPWPAVAIVDLRMPGIDGLELARRLRSLPRGAELKILLTSASVIAFDPSEAIRAGCDDFLPKPFRTVDLLEKLGRLLDLAWRESDSVSPFPVSSDVQLPIAVRAILRECLATGDLEAFAAELERQRAMQPASAAAVDELATAAAGFQLARLRQLLE